LVEANISDDTISAIYKDEVFTQLEKCNESHKLALERILGGPSEADPTFETAELDSAVETAEHESVVETDELEPADSVSQVSAHVSTTSSALAHRIEIDVNVLS